MLGRTVTIISTLPVLFVVTYRPEFKPTWIGPSHVTTFTINRLPRREVDIMIDNLAGDQPIAAGIRQDIMNRSDGVPLFVEEVTKAVLEAVNQTDPDQVINAPSSLFDVPATLQASLMARLDRLGAAKEVAQIGASIGREFSYALLAAIIHQSESELQLALDRLVGAGLLFQLGVPPQSSYLFKHALVQDAAYSTLLREPKRALHARIAEVLETEFEDVVHQHPELLAHHCTEAGLIERAASLWGSAGQRSLGRSALIEAAVQLSRALDQIATLPSTSALRAKQIEFQVALINPLMHVKGYGAPETKAAAERAGLLIEDANRVVRCPRTLSWYSLFCTASQWSISSRSTVRHYANLPNNSLHSLRLKVRLSHSWLVTASWATLGYLLAILRKAGSIMIVRSHSMMARSCP